MTEFEQQVAKALSAWVTAGHHGGPVHSDDPGRTWIECQLEELVPRVAAAINDALKRLTADTQKEPTFAASGVIIGGPLITRALQDALAALRGEP